MGGCVSKYRRHMAPLIGMVAAIVVIAIIVHVVRKKKIMILSVHIHQVF